MSTDRDSEAGVADMCNFCMRQIVIGFRLASTLKKRDVETS